MSFLTLGFLMILPFASLGSLLPTWMFINALQLLAHLPLLNSNMPANAHYFLNKYLDIVRWYDSDFIKSLEDDFNLKKYDTEVGVFHELLKACGYEHLFMHNMLLVFAAITLIVMVWVGLAVKDLIGHYTKSERPFMKRRHENKCNNFALRFFYEFFLEFCIVVFIQLSVTDFSEISPSFSYVLSILLVTCVVGLTVLVVSLFFCRGPYVDGYYQKGTAATHIWGTRPVNPEFDVYGYLKANKPKKKKHRGWFKIVTGSKKNAKVIDPDSVADPTLDFAMSARRSVAESNSNTQKEMMANNDPEDTMQTDRGLLVKPIRARMSETPMITPRLPKLPLSNHTNDNFS